MIRKVTKEEIDKGYIVCECGKYVHIIKKEVLERLPKGYSGELCKECMQWVCDIEKIHPGVRP